MNLHLFTNTLAGKPSVADRPSGLSTGGLRFDGWTYDEAQDQKRLGTLLIRVYNVLKDGQPHTLPELVLKCGGSETGVSAKIRDLRKARFGGHTIEATRKHGGTWAYKLLRSA